MGGIYRLTFAWYWVASAVQCSEEMCTLFNRPGVADDQDYQDYQDDQDY